MKSFLTTIFLINITLLHSCTVYNPTSTPLKASYDRGKVKVISIRNDKYIFNNISINDSTYIGIRGKNTTRLYPNQISAVYIKDIEKSKKRTKTLIIITASAGVGLTALFFYAILTAPRY
jgi:hypothetical protein